MAVHLSHSLHLHADGLSASYGGRRVFTDLGFAVAPGQRLGLIGENGVGKSTLLRLIAGVDERSDAASAALDEADVSGRLTRPVRTGLLRQELPFRPEQRLRDVIEAALAEVRTMERELDDAAAALADPGVTDAGAAAASARYSAALDAAERADVWSVEARRDEVLDGLGVSGISLDRRIDEVSGGQRSRFALAALLLSSPDALLLDEPTNHLDDDAATYLEDRLRAWRGPVLFASHDREFLDRVATALLDLDPGRAGALQLAASGATAGASRDEVLAASGGTVFGGGFSEYLSVKAEERERWERQYDDEQEELRRLRLAATDTARNVSHGRAATDNDKFITKFKRANVEQTVSRRVRNVEQRLVTLERDQVRKPPALLEFAGIPSGSHALEEPSGLLLQLSGVSVAGRLEVGSLQVAPLTRLLVTGAIGAGKSTLLGVLAGTQSVDAGTVQRRRGLRVQLLEQDVRFADPDASPRRLYERVLGARRAEQVPLTSLGLIAARDADRPVGALSVGQQRRLALALVIARPPHVFLLDEPTNHLSLGLATDLEAALGSYPGAVVIASHDRWLRRRWAAERLQLDAGRLVGEAVLRS
ncbi:macrolide transport system ATP-binding/permease protein [Agromyces sp. 3263]|uniref:ABC-F family ATP-binding cassette domain-containing protein n=1 Tax=Agromyces sp. 3263 TaxID=2817750 RepID=UPI00285ACC68|nr:ABC-F family ATP-binding cassette domain-containing protein [Agromyces sp. 3263]MDR6904820.1 macrolide transport system ATP-binding/permease protein [Agromyces sp. 3263]